MSKKRTKQTDATKASAADQPAAQDATDEDAAPRAEAVDALAAAMANEADEAPKQEADPLEALLAELQEAKNRELRMHAELDNYRKRVARQMVEEQRYANLPLMRDLLPVLDNMDRAIEAAEKTHDTAQLLEGIKMVARQLEEVFERYQCVRIEALNQPFDPHLHEAISQQRCDDHPGGTVVLETQTGFQLHDRVVRPSQVIVSTTEPNE